MCRFLAVYFFARQWRILSKFVCFAIEGSHRRFKLTLRNSGGLTLSRGKLGLHVVVDNDTIDDNLRREVCDPTKRTMQHQGPLSVRAWGGGACVA